MMLMSPLIAGDCRADQLDLICSLFYYSITFFLRVSFCEGFTVMGSSMI